MTPNDKDDAPSREPRRGSIFPTTQWTIILTAKADTPDREAALNDLCGRYWYPLYAYFRWRERTPADAGDCTQEVFSKLLQRDFLTEVSRDKGRFRDFLLAAAKNHLKDDGRRAGAQKRSPKGGIFSFDAKEAEARYVRELSSGLNSEEVFERRWAMAVLETALKRCEKEWTAAGKGELFKRLESSLQGEKTAPYREIASQCDMTEAAVKMAAVRLKRRMQEILREEVLKTTATKNDLDEEMRHLQRVLSNSR